MFSKSLVCLLAILLVSAAHAAPPACLDLFRTLDSPILQEFKSLLAENPSKQYVLDLTERIYNEHSDTMSFGDFVTLKNWAGFRNFSDIETSNFLNTYSHGKPLTTEQIRQVLKGENIDTVTAVLSGLHSAYPGERLAKHGTVFDGTVQDYFDLVSEALKSHSKAGDGQKIVNGIFGDFKDNVDFLRGFHFSQEQVEQLIMLLPYKSLSYKNLAVLENSVPLVYLLNIDLRVLLSRMGLNSTGDYLGNAHSLGVILFGTPMTKIIDARINENFPDVDPELLITVLATKTELGKTAPAEQDEIAARIFTELYQSWNSEGGIPHLMGQEFFRVAWDIATNVEHGIYTEDQVYALEDVVTWMQKTYAPEKRNISYNTTFFKTFFVDQLRLNAGANPEQLTLFFSSYFKEYKELLDRVAPPPESPYSWVYPFPLPKNRGSVPADLLRQGFQLLSLQLGYGGMNSQMIRLYFDLRIGIAEGQPTVLQTWFGGPAKKMTEAEALVYITKRLAN